MRSGRDPGPGEGDDRAHPVVEADQGRPRVPGATPSNRSPWIVPVWAVGLYSLFFGPLGVHLAWLVLLQMRTADPHQPSAPVLLAGLVLGVGASYLACVLVGDHADADRGMDTMV